LTPLLSRYLAIRIVYEGKTINGRKQDGDERGEERRGERNLTARLKMLPDTERKAEQISPQQLKLKWTLLQLMS
jgi:hypothetical protein